MYKVFISYRRSDCAERAMLIYSHLLNWYAEECIFLDTQEIHEGSFPVYIEEALNSAETLVLLISKDSFNSVTRPTEKIDFYYEEIKRAITKGIKIIPIVYDNINYDDIEFPEGMETLRILNAIYSHTDDPNGLKNRLYEFTCKRQKSIKDWIAFPLAIITIYIAVSLISGIGMYLYDRFTTSYEDAVEIASEHIIMNEDTFIYPIAEDRLIIYTPKTKEIKDISTANDENISIILPHESIYKIGFWSTTTALFYKIVKSRYKPHNSKQYLAYVGIAVSIISGVGLGCTVEQIIFPQHRVKMIEDNIYNPVFWQDVINRKYMKFNRHIYQ